MHRADFQASDCTTSRWLRQEIMNGLPSLPLPRQTDGCTLTREANLLPVKEASGAGSVSTAATAAEVISMCACPARAALLPKAVSSIERSDQSEAGFDVALLWAAAIA